MDKKLTKLILVNIGVIWLAVFVDVLIVEWLEIKIPSIGAWFLHDIWVAISGLFVWKSITMPME